MFYRLRFISLAALTLLVLTEITGPASAQRHADDNPGHYVGERPDPKINSLRFQDAVEAYDSRQYRKAFDIWLPLARNNDPAAMRNVAHMLRRGLGVERDINRAVYFYQRAADMGLMGASANLGLIYLTGLEGDDFGPAIAQSDDLATRFLVPPAQAGHILAQYLLAGLHEKKEGRDDQELALYWYGKAALAGHDDAMDKLAMLTRKLPPRHLESPEPAPQASSTKEQVQGEDGTGTAAHAATEAAPEEPDIVTEGDGQVSEEANTDSEDANQTVGDQALEFLAEQLSDLNIKSSSSNAPRAGGRNR